MVGIGVLGAVASSGGADPLTAFGGIITQYTHSGTTYRVHTYRSSGVFNVVSGSANADWLVVGGGGGNGGFGGGGAGGMLTGTGVAVEAGTYSVTVGPGGAGHTGSGGTRGTNGADSTFNAPLRGVIPREYAVDGMPTYSAATIGTTAVRQLDFQGIGKGYALTQPLGSAYTAVGDWTVAVWIYMDAHNTDGSPISYFMDLRGNTGSITNAGGVYLNIGNTGTGQVKCGTDTAEATWSNVGFSTGAWTHFLVTKTGTTHELWVDGVSEGDQTASSGNANFNASGGTLGNYCGNLTGASNAYWFNGKAAEFAVWNTTLDDTNVGAVYASGNPIDLTSNSGSYDQSDSLIGYFVGLGNTTQSLGGGYGSIHDNNGSAGGSGGGAGSGYTSAGADPKGRTGGTSSADGEDGGDGYLGSAGTYTGVAAGGGGGGKGAVGADAAANTGGNGGNGATGYGITATTPTYAGGGGGGGYNAGDTIGTGGTGGNGGGANGQANTCSNAPNATDGTGGGGGGGAGLPASCGSRSGDGGNGIVIIRRPTVKTTYNNMTLASNAYTAQADPETIRIIMDEYTSIGSAAVNVDIKAYASRDNGTTYTQITTLADQGAIETNHRLLSGSVDVSGQPAGSSVKYKIETLNQSATKATRIYGASMAWA